MCTRSSPILETITSIERRDGIQLIPKVLADGYQVVNFYILPVATADSLLRKRGMMGRFVSRVSLREYIDDPQRY